MNIYTKRSYGPPTLIRDMPIHRQSVQRQRDNAWTEKMNSQMNDYLDATEVKQSVTRSEAHRAIAKATGEQA